MIRASLRIVKLAGSVFSEHANQHSEDVDMVAEDRLHRSVRRLEPESVAVTVKLLQGRFAFVVANGDDLPVARLLLAANDDIVSVGDVLLDHRISGDAKGELLS